MNKQSFRLSSRTLFGVIVTAISFALLFISFKRDLIYEKDYTGDLRNRVVGARLIADGKSPYFYKWRVADSTRYYDPNSFGDGKVSNITATPFFHQLLIPISGLPQSTISKIWLWTEYIMLLLIVLIMLSFCNSNVQKTVVIFTASAFLFTEAWKDHVFTGQMYLVIAFLSSLFIYLFYKAKNNFTYFICGIAAASLILIRLNFIVFFLPFIFLLPRLKLKSVFALLFPGIIGVLFILTNPFQRQLWSDFFTAVKTHTHIHQGEPVQTGIFPADPKYSEWEGIDMKNASTITPDMRNYPKSENGNFFVLVRIFLHKKIGSFGLIITSLLLIGSLFFTFYFVLRKKAPTISDLRILAALGFCFYMITDLFSPVYRHQYYTVQWIPAVLLFLTVAKFKPDFWFIFLIFAGIILNMVNVPFIKMEHTMGEYLILVVLICYSFVYFNRKSIEA